MKVTSNRTKLKTESMEQLMAVSPDSGNKFTDGNNSIQLCCRSYTKNSWLISEPLLLNGSCNPDAGVAIKNISQSLEIYSHTYEEAGTYTATFVANNANYVHQGGQVVRELTINVVE